MLPPHTCPSPTVGAFLIGESIGKCVDALNGDHEGCEADSGKEKST
jgi:hypothetical protein